MLVNEHLDILQFRGSTAAYLEPPTGEASFNLLRMARGSLALELGSAIREAKSSNVAVRRESVRLRDGARVRSISLEILPVRLPASDETCFQIFFQEAAASENLPPPDDQQDALLGSEREQEQLRRELAAARDYLQSVIEQQDAANEELRSANEEVLSANEELQSTNEELETAKEELQSSNEELTTLNEELQSRNAELGQLNNDLINLLGSVRIPIVMLGTDLRIRRFNQSAGAALNLLSADIGRPIGDLRTSVEMPDLERLLSDVISDVVVKEREVQDRDGRWFALRVHPYRTTDNRIDGAILTLVDIDAVKRSQQLLQAAEYTRAIVDTLPWPLLVLTADLRVKTANRSFYEIFRVSPQETEGRYLYKLGSGQWNIPSLCNLLRNMLPIAAHPTTIPPEMPAINEFEVERSFPAIGRRTMLLNARVLYQSKITPDQILLAIEDITVRKRSEEATARLAGIVEFSRDAVIGAPDAIGLKKEPVDLRLVISNAVEGTRSLIQGRGHNLHVSLGSRPLRLEGDAARLEQIVTHLLNNAAKFTDPGGSIWLTAERELFPWPAEGKAPEAKAEQVVIRVRDTGVGIPAEMLPRVFDLFVQVDRSPRRSQGGLGIGLFLVRTLVELHGGGVSVESAGPGQGSEFAVRLPIGSPGQAEANHLKDGKPRENP